MSVSSYFFCGWTCDQTKAESLNLPLNSKKHLHTFLKYFYFCPCNLDYGLLYLNRGSLISSWTARTMSVVSPLVQITPATAWTRPVRPLSVEVEKWAWLDNEDNHSAMMCSLLQKQKTSQPLMIGVFKTITSKQQQQL